VCLLGLSYKNIRFFVWNLSFNLFTVITLKYKCVYHNTLKIGLYSGKICTYTVHYMRTMPETNSQFAFFKYKEKCRLTVFWRHTVNSMHHTLLDLYAKRYLGLVMYYIFIYTAADPCKTYNVCLLQYGS